MSAPDMSPSLLRPLLTLDEVAAILRLSPRTVWSYTADGSLPTIRLGRSVRVTPADLEEFTRGRKKGGKS